MFLGDDGVASNLVFCIIDTDFLVSLPSWAAVKGIVEEGGAALMAGGGVGVLELGELLKVGSTSQLVCRGAIRVWRSWGLLSGMWIGELGRLELFDCFFSFSSQQTD